MTPSSQEMESPEIPGRFKGGNHDQLQRSCEDHFFGRLAGRKNLKAPDQRRWALEKQLMYLFDNLIFNDDRNQTNILYDSAWKLWMIDHTRAFRRFTQLRNPQIIRYCERSVLG